MTVTEETDCMCQADGLMGELRAKGEDPFRNRESTENGAAAQPGYGSGECLAQLWGHWSGGMEGFGTASTHCHGSR